MTDPNWDWDESSGGANGGYAQPQQAWNANQYGQQQAGAGPYYPTR